MTNLKMMPTKLSNKHKNMLDKAIQLAETSTYTKYRHAAIIVQGSKIVATGKNSMIIDLSTISAANFPDKKNGMRGLTVHAEVAALRMAKKMNLNNAILYVARIGNDGVPRMSKPCVNCQAALREAGIKKVYYTIESEMDL